MGGGRLHRLKPPLSWGYCKLSRRRKQNGVQDRAKWLQTAANIFDLINKGEGGTWRSGRRVRTTANKLTVRNICSCGIPRPF
jgi:hypothetical protein